MGGYGFCVANEESEEQAEDCTYGEVISSGYTGSVLSIVEEKDRGHMSYFRGLLYNIGDVQNKSDPKWIELTKISTACKYIAAIDIDGNTSLWGLKTLFRPFTFPIKSERSDRLRGNRSMTFAKLTP